METATNTVPDNYKKRPYFLIGFLVSFFVYLFLAVNFSDAYDSSQNVVFKIFLKFFIQIGVTTILVGLIFYLIKGRDQRKARHSLVLDNFKSALLKAFWGILVQSSLVTLTLLPTVLIMEVCRAGGGC